jgi:hypothetical protein
MAAKLTGTLVLDQGSVENDHFSSVASKALDADKIQPYFVKGTPFGFAIGATPTTREEIVHVATVAGTIRGFHALLNDTGTSTGITFDLKKNGTTCLSATVSLTQADSDRSVKDGTLSVTSIAADDVLSILMTVTSSTGAQGPYAFVNLEENNAGT